MPDVTLTDPIYASDINASGRRNLKTGLTNAQIAQNGITSIPLGSSTSTTAMSGAGSTPININNQVADNNLGYRLNQASLLQPALVNTMEMGNDVSNQQFGLATRQEGLADSAAGTYRSYLPATQQFIGEASSYGNRADQEAQAAKAGAAVDSSAAAAREASSRRMTSMGINPNSGKAIAAQESADVATAANKAAAMTTAADTARDKGIALRQTTAQMGMQALNGAGSAASTAASLGTSAANTANTGVTDVLNTTSMVGQGFNAQQGAQATAQGASDSAASRQLASERYHAEQDASDTAAWTSAAGSLGSIIGSLWG